MALTISTSYSVPPVDQLLTVRNVDFDASYDSGGESLTFSQLGFLHEPAIVLFGPKGGYRFEYDYSAQKVKVLWGDNNNAADGPLVELPAATDLSSLTGVRVVAIGRYGL